MGRVSMLGFAIGMAVAVVSAHCCIECLGLATVAFVCDPSEQPVSDQCPHTHLCCADDAAAVGGGLPSYGDGVDDPADPFFAGEQNPRGRSGMCVNLSEIPNGFGVEPYNCPKPCNPTWTVDEIASVCAAGRACCQTVELDETDCMLDDATQMWRPADGADALASLDGGTNWRPVPASTNLDPDFTACEAIAGDRTSAAFRDCVAQLTTANQRGYCMGLGPGQECPTASDEYIDPCESKNE